MSIPVLPLDFYRIALDDEQFIVALDSRRGLTMEAKIRRVATPYHHFRIGAYRSAA